LRDDVESRLLFSRANAATISQARIELIARIDDTARAIGRRLLDLMRRSSSADEGPRPAPALTTGMADFAKFATAVGPVLGFRLAT